MSITEDDLDSKRDAMVRALAKGDWSLADRLERELEAMENSYFSVAFVTDEE